MRTLRRKGDVPLSRKLNQTGALVGALVGLAAVSGVIARSFAEYATLLLAHQISWLDALVAGGRLFASAALPVAGAAAVGAVSLGAIQTGMIFAPKRLAPDMSRFQLGQAWKSQFRMDALVNGTIALVAVTLCTAAATVGVNRLVQHAPDLAERAATEGGLAVAGAVGDTLAMVGGVWLIVAVTVAAIDLQWQRVSFLNRNKMSLQQIRDEYKQSEGDPEHKARRERAHRDLLRGDLRSGVKEADVVIVNPVRIAVGLRYRPDELDAPVVTVTGRGDRAKAIKREARRKHVPEYADRKAARAIVDLEVGDTVPEELFEPIAIIFRWVNEVQAAEAAKAKSRRS
ncbi:MAG: flagellar biosynthesis protein FlhB [Bradymonadia bacterium]